MNRTASQQGCSFLGSFSTEELLYAAARLRAVDLFFVLHVRRLFCALPEGLGVLGLCALLLMVITLAKPKQ
jgi:hypothetical protein